MAKPTYEDLLKENKRQSLLLEKMAGQNSDILGKLLDGEALLKSNIKYLESVTKLIEGK